MSPNVCRSPPWGHTVQLEVSDVMCIRTHTKSMELMMSLLYTVAR